MPQRGRLSTGMIVGQEFICLGALLHQQVQQIPQVETNLHHGTSGFVLLYRELYVGFSHRIAKDSSAPLQMPET